jgi:hypothetical protein
MNAHKITIAMAMTFLASGSTLAAEAVVTRGMACYNIGYRYVTCALASAGGLTCPAGWDFVVPDRCQKTNEFMRGMKEGMADFHDKVKSLSKEINHK